MTLPAALEENVVRKWINHTNLSEEKTIISGHSRVTAYKSSPLEIEWLLGPKRGQICRFSNSAEQIEGAKIWLNYSKSTWASRGVVHQPSDEQLNIFSIFYVGSTLELIEPLHGIARNPFAKVGCGGMVDIFNIQYLVLPNFCSQKVIPKSIFFDMGASIGFSGTPEGILNVTPSKGDKIAGSIPLFNRLYFDKCLVFDEIYAWEPNIGVSHEEWWGSAPPEIRAKVRFFEIGVNEGELSEAMQGVRNPGSFLRMLETTVSADDFVVVKLDIDAPHVEHVVMQTLASNHKLADLIDELYVEYHFYFDGMDFGWHRKVFGDVDSALWFMYRMRSVGVRAHFWI